jgi:hypothetical protein
VAQFVVVVQVLVAECDPGDPLHQQRLHAVHGVDRIAVVLEAASQAAYQPQRLVRGAEQQRTGVAGDLAAVETRNHRASFHACKLEPVRVTLCLHRAFLRVRVNSLSQKNFRSFGRPMHLIRVRNAG